MFEAAETHHSVDKKSYARRVQVLRERLLDAQFDLNEGQRFPVIVLVSGGAGAGKAGLVHTLNEWFDPRLLSTHAFPFSQQGDGYPPGWKY